MDVNKAIEALLKIHALTQNPHWGSSTISPWTPERKHRINELATAALLALGRNPSPYARPTEGEKSNG